MFSSYGKVHVQLDLAENVHIIVNTVDVRGKRLREGWEEWKNTNDTALTSQIWIELCK